MLFAPYERYHYARSPLVEVICQLRFPTILSIGANEPAAFQEAVRRDFPRYMARQEQLPPKVVKKTIVIMKLRFGIGSALCFSPSLCLAILSLWKAIIGL